MACIIIHVQIFLRKTRNNKKHKHPDDVYWLRSTEYNNGHQNKYFRQQNVKKNNKTKKNLYIYKTQETQSILVYTHILVYIYIICT